MTTAAVQHARRPLAHQLSAYVVVGGINTAISLALLWLFYHSGLPYPVYTTLVYGIMIFVSFELNRRFTFVATRPSSTQYRRWLTNFCALHVTNLAMIQLLQAMLIERLHIPQYVAVVTAALAGMVTGFIGSKLIFESRRPAADAGERKSAS